MFASILDWLGFGAAGHSAHGNHGHAHHDSHGEGGHGHTHGVIDPTLATTERGIWAIKWSFVILAATAVMQIFVVIISSSVALLADTIHNVGDAATAVPLWIAFVLARRKPSARFNYGLGRVEDLAGIIIVAIILFSALVAGYQAIDRLINPQAIGFLAAVAAAGIVGFIGNEVVAVLRIRVGREIDSAALIADGYHARVDGLTSLAVVLGAFGVWLGFPIADPIVGLIITGLIFGIVWQSARAVFTRMLDGVEPELLDELQHCIEHVPGIAGIEAIRCRWIGHRLHAEADLRVDTALSMGQGIALAQAAEESAKSHLPALERLRVNFVEQAHGHDHDEHGHDHPHADAHASEHDEHGHDHPHADAHTSEHDEHGHGHPHAEDAHAAEHEDHGHKHGDHGHDHPH